MGASVIYVVAILLIVILVQGVVIMDSNLHLRSTREKLQNMAEYTARLDEAWTKLVNSMMNKDWHHEG